MEPVLDRPKLNQVSHNSTVVEKSTLNTHSSGVGLALDDIVLSVSTWLLLGLSVFLICVTFPVSIWLVIKQIQVPKILKDDRQLSIEKIREILSTNQR